MIKLVRLTDDQIRLAIDGMDALDNLRDQPDVHSDTGREAREALRRLLAAALKPAAQE